MKTQLKFIIFLVLIIVDSTPLLSFNNSKLNSQSFGYNFNFLNADTLTAIDYYDKGVILLGQKNYKEALLNFDKAIVMKPDFAEAYNERANAKFDGDIFEKNQPWAWDDYQKAIDIKPNLAKPYFDRGMRKNLIQDIRNKPDGCPDICKAYELGYPKSEYFFSNCDCKK